MTVHVVIPARIGSTRLPRKPLRLLAGRPLVLHCVDRAREAGFEPIVATDAPEIAEVARLDGVAFQLTSPHHPSGSDRLAEVAEVRGWGDDEIVVNVQGDMPLLPPSVLEDLADAMRDAPHVDIGTVACPVLRLDDLRSEAVVKVVVGADGDARYFSRAPIPYVRGADLEVDDPSILRDAHGAPRFLQHVGLYAYRVGVLHRFLRLPRAPEEDAESLEQLRALHWGLRVYVTRVASAVHHGVDTVEDLREADARLRARVRVVRESAA